MEAKRKEADVVAFITNINSPRKTSLRFTLQTDAETTKRTILFDMSQAAKVREKHSSGEPIKIKRALLEQPTNKNFAEIVVNSRSVIEDPQPEDVNFARKEALLKITKISDIPSKCPDEMISVQGKLTFSSKIRLVQSYGKQTKLAEENYISDNTGTVKLTLWENWINEFETAGGKFIKIFNLVVKEFEGKKYLATSVDTFMTELENPIENVVIKIPNQVKEVVIKEVTGVGKFNYTMMCPTCQKQNPAKVDPIVTCNHCEFSSKANRFQKTLLIPIISDELEEKVHIDYENLVIKYPRLSSKDIFRVDEQRIKETLFSIKNESVIVENRLIKFKTNVLSNMK